MLIAFCQYLAAAASTVLVNIFYDLKIEGAENLKEVPRPVIVVTNHESYLDPQLVGVALLRRPSLFPLRYMAKRELFLIPVLNILIWLLGAFVVVKGRGLDRNLRTPFRILQQRGAVIIFPEGGAFSRRGELAKGRHGAAALAIMTGATLLPIALHTPYMPSPWRYLVPSQEAPQPLRKRWPMFLRELAKDWRRNFQPGHEFGFWQRRIVKVNIGVPFYLNNIDYPDIADVTTEKATEKIMTEIGRLYGRHRY